MTYLDPTRIEFIDKELFADRPGGQLLKADLVAKVAFRGREAFFLDHLEPQGRRQQHFPARMFRYFTGLHHLQHLPVYPIAVLSYGARLPEAHEYTVEFPDLEVLKFRFATVKLKQLPWRDFLRSPNPIASALMAQMKFSRKERPRVKLECLRLLLSSRVDRGKAKLLSSFIDTYLQLDEREQVLFELERKTLPMEEEQAVLELTTSWKEEGIAEGIRIVEEREKKRGEERERRGLELSVQCRFGQAGLAALSRIVVRVTPDNLEEVARAVYSAQDLAALEELARRDSL